MHRRRFWLLAAALIGVLSLTTAASAGLKSHHGLKVRNGGTLIFGAEQEPDGLNLNLACCTLSWGQYIETPIMRGSWLIKPDYTYAPDVITHARTQLNPFRVTYYINPKAKWNAGNYNLPITVNDYTFTWHTIMDPKNDMASRAGYDQIKSIKGSNKGRTVLVTFTKPYADWKDMFNALFPQKALQGEDFNKVWLNDLNNPKNGKPISDGPFQFQSWNKGSSLTIVKDPTYWNKAHRAHLNAIVFRFLTNTNTEIEQMKGKEVNAIYPQPQLQLSSLRGQAGILIQSSRGPTWEHVDIQQGPKGDPALKNIWVRQALAYGINRQALVTQLFKTITPGLQPLNNIIYMSNQPQYKGNAHWSKWTYNPTKAQQLLTSHGCTKGSDGIFSCGGHRLSFKFTFTAGNQLRQLAFEVMQAQLKDVGIELVSAAGPASVVFGSSVLEAGNYDLFMFAWQGSPDPGGNVEIWKCGGGQNFTGYCNQKVSQLLEQSDTTIKPKVRASLFNQADALMANDLPTIPLYQKPTFLVYSSNVKGMQDNSTLQGPTWNAETWWLSS